MNRVRGKDHMLAGQEEKHVDRFSRRVDVLAVAVRGA